MAFIRSRYTAWLLILLFAVIFIELILIAPGYLNKPSEQESAAPRKKSIARSEPGEPLADQFTQSMRGVHVVEAKNDKREWELWSDVASTFKNTGNLALETVKTKFFGDDGVFFIVTGQEGSVEAASKDMFITGEVATESSNGYRFLTNQIRYDSQDRELITEQPVTITGPAQRRSDRLHLTGNSLRADLLSSTIFVEGNVRAQKGVDIKGQKVMHIKASSALLSAQTNEVSFSGGVFINLHGMRISGPSARFLYKPNSGQIAAVELEGGVRVSDQNKWATSEKVRVDLDRELYVFKGSPKVVQQNDELFGDEIVFEDGGKKVKVKNARVKVSREHLEE